MFSDYRNMNFNKCDQWVKLLCKLTISLAITSFYNLYLLIISFSFRSNSYILDYISLSSTYIFFNNFFIVYSNIIIYLLSFLVI